MRLQRVRRFCPRTRNLPRQETPIASCIRRCGTNADVRQLVQSYLDRIDRFDKRGRQ